VPQLINLMVNGVIRVNRVPLPLWAVDTISVVRHISPPGLVIQALHPETNPLLFSLGLLMGYIGLALLLQVRQLRATYLGEMHSETFRTERELKVKPGWKIPGLSEAVSTIVEKEMRYIRQNSRLLVTLAYPVILFLFILIGNPGRGMTFAGMRSGAGPLGAFAGLLAISISNMAFNTFGMDREGFGRWLLSPLPLNRVMLAKNIAQGTIMTGIYLFGTLALLIFRPVSWEMLAAISLGFLSLVIIYLGSGNVISVYWPKRIEFAQMKSRMTSSASGFAALLVMLPTTAIIAVVVAATWSLGLRWLPLIASIVGLAASIRIYQWLSVWAARHAEAHLEEIAGQLGV